MELKSAWTSSLLRRPCSRPIGPPFWPEFEFNHDHDHHHDVDYPDAVFSPPVSQNCFYYTDNVELTTVGIDVGSSTSHLIFSRLHLQRLGQYLSSRYVFFFLRMRHPPTFPLFPYPALFR